MSETAGSAGLARGSLTKAMGEGANPTLPTLLAVLNALGVQLSAKPMGQFSAFSKLAP